MPKNQATEIAEAGLGHNSDARAAAIREVLAELDRLDDEIKLLQDERTKLKQAKIKGDLGFKMSDFNLGRRLYKLDTDDRNVTLKIMREMFGALGIGEQSSFLGAIDAPETGTKHRGRPRKVKPEDLGETVNKPHVPIQSDEEFEAATPVVDLAESPDDHTEEADEPVFGEADGADEVMNDNLSDEREAAE